MPRVFLYWARLDGPVETPLVERCLPIGERERAARIRDPRQARRFLHSRLLVRRILADLVDCAPLNLPLERPEQGKPFLRDLSWDFNLAHSGDHFVLAASPEVSLGVDLEEVRPQAQIDGIVQRFFHASEWTAFRNVPLTERTEVFFRAWTRKEAYLKGTGQGITGLKQISVSLDPASPSPVHRWEGGIARETSWRLQELAAPTGCVACLATDRGEPRLLIRSLPQA